MTEQKVENLVRDYLSNKGWKLTNLPKSIGQHGCDITAWHPVNRRVFLIEAKGSGSPKIKHQTIHNSFYTLLGQILSRMDKQGNHPKKARIYAIAIPESWGKVYAKKIKKMIYAWDLLKLRVFLVNKNDVNEFTYKQFIKKYGKN